MHDEEFIRTVASAKCSLPFIAIGYTDEIVNAAKVNRGEGPGRAWAI